MVNVLAKKYVLALYQLLNVSFRTIASSVGTVAGWEKVILMHEIIVRENSLTFQDSRHDSCVPQVCDADQQKTNILNRFIRIRTGIAVQQSN